MLLSASCARREIHIGLMGGLCRLLCTAAVLMTGLAAIAADAQTPNTKWVASWATAPAAYLVYTAPVPENQALGTAPARFAAANVQPDLAFPFPNANTRGATTQTIRSIVKPDLW